MAAGAVSRFLLDAGLGPAIAFPGWLGEQPGL